MSFLIDINPKLELPSYNLMLCKSSEEPVGSLRHISDLKISTLFVGVDNLSFSVPLNIANSDGTEFRNRMYDLIEGDYLIRVNDDKYFTVVNVKESASTDGKKYKEVQCKSREYELINKKLVDYQADSRKLYDSTDSMSDGIELGILNYIFNHLTKSWVLDHVDPTLQLREGKGIFRSLNFSNSNLLQVFSELQKIYNCVFFFDTKLRKVNVYDIKTIMGEYKGMYISDTNFIKSITKTTDSEGIVTRLFIRGKDGISIQSITPTGQPYLDNFDFYKKPKYMSAGLIAALDVYKAKVSNYNPNFSPVYIRLNAAKEQAETLLNKDHADMQEKGLTSLKRSLGQVQILIDVKVAELAFLQSTISTAEGTELESLYSTKISIESAMALFIEDRVYIKNLIQIKEDQIEAQNLIIKEIETEIVNLQAHLKAENPDNFTAAQLKELDSFIKVETYNDTNFTENNLEELKEEGIRQLARLSQPKIQFTVDVIDFLSLIECQKTWRKFVLGDAVMLEHKDMDIKLSVRLVGYDHSPESNSLSLKFSNTNSYDDATLYERDLADQSDRIANTVDFESGKWSDVGNVESRISKLIDSKLNDAKQNLLDAVGQKHLFGDDGLWLYKENPDGTLDPSQIRAINNTIALTKNNWTNVSTAITPDGIVASEIFGKLGKFASIEADQIVVGGGAGDPNILDYINIQNQELITATNTLRDNINEAFSDNSITNIESHSLELNRNGLVKEASDIRGIAISFDLDTSALDSKMALLNIEVNKYVEQPKYPITVAKVDRESITQAFIALESAIVALYRLIDDKRDTNVKSYVDAEVRELNTSLSDLNAEIDLAFSDNSITNIEANSLDLARKSVIKEAEDVKAIAVSYSVSTTAMDTAMNNLNNQINLYMTGPYPIEVNSTKRSAITSAFTTLGSAITNVSNQIDTARLKTVVVHQILLSNENQSIVTNSSGLVTSVTSITSKIDVYRGIEKIDATIGNLVLKSNGGDIIAFGTFTKTNPTQLASGSIQWSIPANTNISADSGYIEIPIVAESKNYIKVLTWNKAKSGKDGIDGIDGGRGQDGTSQYFHIRYSQNSDGTGFTPSALNAIYMGTAVTPINSAPLDKGGYTWALIKGANGTNGTRGEDGKDGQPTYLHIKYSDNGTSFTSNEGETVGNWMGTYVDHIKVDSMVFSDYTWKKFVGEDGYTPIKGTDYFDGIDGQDGQDGISSYIWVKYSAHLDGTDFNDVPNKYIGVATTTTPTIPTLKTQYKWTKIEGTDGTNGIKGEKGTDGQTSYLHIKYSNNGTSFTANSGETVGDWIGTYVDFVEADSMTFSQYVWNKVRGNDGYTPVKGTDYFDGEDGQDGVSNYLWIKYSASSDGTGFNDTPNKYVGVATTTTSVAPTNKALYKWSKIEGTDGTNGIKGETGNNGQTSYLHIKYSDNGISFTANNGETVGGWIGTYVDFIEADSTTFSKYTWNKVKGSDGYTPVKGADYFDGVDGNDGIDGVSNYLWVKYSASADGTNFNDSPNKYIGVATTTTSTAPTLKTAYKWTKIEGTDGSNGIKGETGTSGQTSYLHIKYSDNGTSFTANSGETVGAWIGTYVDFTEADSTTFSKYTWNKVKGTDARIVTVAPSHSSFISKNMVNPSSSSSYEPASITITPDFQNCNYSKWEYSRDGVTWTQITRTTTSTTLPYMNSSTRVLTIPRAWSVYSSSQTFVIFKVTSATSEYDLVTIPRLFDSTTLVEGVLKQDFQYNRTKITEAEGIEVFDNLGNRVLQVGGIATGTTQTKNNYGFKAEHSDGSFTALTRGGLVRKVSGIEKPYNYLTHIEPVYYEFAVNTSQSVGTTQNHYIPSHIVTLPSDFKGKNFKVFSTMGSFSANNGFATNMAEGYIKLNGVNYANATVTMEIGISVTRISSSLPNANPHWIEIGLIATA